MAGLDEMCQWVMSLGPEACVMEPPELRAMVAVSLNSALEQYDVKDLEAESSPGNSIYEGHLDYA